MKQVSFLLFFLYLKFYIYFFLNFFKKDNHFKCLNTLESWRQKCDPVVRRLQLQERDRLKMDQRLYTAEQLQDYNRRKNIQWRDFATLKGDF